MAVQQAKHLIIKKCIRHKTQTYFLSCSNFSKQVHENLFSFNLIYQEYGYEYVL